MIEIENLVKVYGTIRAVDGINFTVEKGQVLGFLGPNGAGKSTTMKIITGFIPPTSGTVRVGGLDIHDDPIGVRRQIGYLPESAPSYQEMKVEEFLSFIGEVRGFRGSELEKRIDGIVERTALGEVRNQIIDTLSKGYRQRVCFAQALIHDPPVLILDEPTDGLDPNQKHEMREVIRQMAEEKTIVLSTHILEEMEAVCTRAIIIAHGRILVDGSPEDLAAMSPHHNAVVLKIAAPGNGLAESLAGIAGVADVRVSGQANGTVFTLLPNANQVILPEVTRFLEGQKVAFDEVFTERGRVDEVFRQVTQGGRA